MKKIAKDIESVSQYLNLIYKIKEVLGTGSRTIPTYFRGEPKCYDQVKASLFRKKYGDNKEINVHDEYDLIHSAEIYYPHIFNGCHDALDKLVMMQHFLLPTRLIDVTSNPLAALYFACEDYNAGDRQEGRVLYVNNVEPCAIATVQLLASISSLQITAFFSLPEIVSKLKTIPSDLDNFSTIERKCLRLYKIITETHLFQPMMSNNRIVAQNGAFVFSPFAKPAPGHEDLFMKLDISKVTLNDLSQLVYDKVSPDIRDIFNKSYFRILPEHKERIIDELDRYGINKATIYPDPEHQMKYIAERLIRNKKNEWEIDMSKYTY